MNSRTDAFHFTKKQSLSFCSSTTNHNFRSRSDSNLDESFTFNRRSATQVLKNSKTPDISRQDRISRLLRTLSLYENESPETTGSKNYEQKTTSNKQRNS